MLLVNASAGPSRIHGTGLIAREPIPKGTLVWELKSGFDLEMTKEFIDNVSPASQEQIRRFVYIDVTTGKYILCSDDAKFMNHSDSPNTRTVGAQTFATREISIGEEITCDYAEFDAATRRRLET
jgi:SET domain-containing protein